MKGVMPTPGRDQNDGAVAVGSGGVKMPPGRLELDLRADTEVMKRL